MFKVFRLVNRSLALFTSVYPEVSGGPPSSSSSTDSADVAATNLTAEAMQKEQRVEQPQAGVKIQVLVPTHLECVPVGRLGLIFGGCFAVQANATLSAWISASVAFETQETYIIYIIHIILKYITILRIYIEFG